VYNAVTQIKPN